MKINKLPGKKTTIGAPGSVLVNATPEHLILAGGQRLKMRDFHDPYCLAWPKDEGRSIRSAARTLYNHIDAAKAEGDFWNGPAIARITNLGSPFVAKSYANPGTELQVCKVYTDNPFDTMRISDDLFWNYGWFTAEHDMPYVWQALSDLGADGTAWMFDTAGEEVTLKVLCYDIEATQWNTLGDQAPVDVLGWGSFEITIRSRMDLDEEDFQMEIVNAPESWKDVDVHVIKATTPEEEAALLAKLATLLENHDIVAGHNMLEYDNVKVHSRVDAVLKAGTAPETHAVLQRFMESAREDKTFTFGKQTQQVILPQANFDTLQVARRVYLYRTEPFTLKALARDLGVHVEGRTYIDHEDLDINDERTLAYAKDDVHEQVGLTLNLISQALSHAHLVGLPIEQAFDDSTTNMWDYMSLVRAARQGKMFPSMVRPERFLKDLVDITEGTDQSREDVVRTLHRMGADSVGRFSKDLIRVMKSGTEAPEWVEYANGIYQSQGGKTVKAMDFIGGMTLKPQDPETNSTFIPFFQCWEADVGAMYPSILKAQNANGDTVRIARTGEEPDAWAWFGNLGQSLIDSDAFVVRPVSKEQDAFTKHKGYRGYMVGLKVSKETGVTSSAMTGVLKASQRAKAAIAAEWNKDNPDMVKVGQLKAIYASMKAVRNSGTHGILSSLTTTCRQFNPMPGAWIPTIGQEILADALATFKERGARIIYGDTDGLVFAGSRNAATDPKFRAILEDAPYSDADIIQPADEIQAMITEVSQRWQQRLNYADFELEPVEHAGYMLVKHKNYLQFAVKDGQLVINVKGTIFKGSDKPQVTLDLVKEVAKKAILRTTQWSDEDSARALFIEALEYATAEVLQEFDPTQFDPADLALKMTVKPAGAYKPKSNGEESDYSIRSKAIQEVLGIKLTEEQRFQFVTCAKPLPSIENPNKTLKKGLDYSWPVTAITAEDVDREWYAAQAEDYIRTVFGLTVAKKNSTSSSRTARAVTPGRNQVLEAWFT